MANKIINFPLLLNFKSEALEIQETLGLLVMESWDFFINIFYEDIFPYVSYFPSSKYLYRMTF